MGYNNTPGGIASGKIAREKAEAAYREKPNICLQCGGIISIEGRKISEIRQKKFCDHTCAATYNNLRREKKITETIARKSREERLKGVTKEDLLLKCKDYFSARATITKIARLTMDKSSTDRICINCGYSKHVEVCHIKAVSEFNDKATLYDINRIENLMYLCPNCHWEYDNKVLNIVRSTRVGPSGVS